MKSVLRIRGKRPHHPEPKKHKFSGKIVFVLSDKSEKTVVVNISAIDNVDAYRILSQSRVNEEKQKIEKKHGSVTVKSASLK